MRQQFLHKLAGYGISRLEPIGEPFDPELHEAIATVPVSDEFAEGIVAGIALGVADRYAELITKLEDA